VSAEVARWLERAPPGWDELRHGDPNATAAQRPEFWQAVSAAVPGITVSFLAIESGGRLIGGMPVASERRGGLHWIHAMPWVLPGAPLARPGGHGAADAVAAAALAGLQRRSRAVGGVWSLYRPAGPPVAAEALERPGGETRWVEAALIEIAGGTEAAWRRIDRKTRQSLAHARATLSFAESPESVAEAWTLHVRQSRGWAGHRPLPLELARRLLAATGADGAPCARLFTVRDRGGLLSAVLALDDPNECFLWWSGTHPEGRARQAFGVLAWSVLEWAAAAGRRRLNLGASPGLEAVASFKSSLGGEPFRYPVRCLDARHATWPGRALAALRRRRGGPDRRAPS